MLNEKPPKTDWSITEEARKKKAEEPKFDWSSTNEAIKKIDAEKRARMSPKEFAEDDRRKKIVENLKRTETPEEKEQRKRETEEKIKAMYKDVEYRKMILNQQFYEAEKEKRKQLRRKHGEKISEEELKKEDQELRKKHGLE